jgi:ribose-phosphate pyrophosphokinase
MKNLDNVLFYSGNGNHQLGAKILLQLREYLGHDINFSHIDFGQFADGESDASIPRFSGIAGQTIVFYQSIYNQALLEEALDLIWAMKRQYQAAYLIAVIPFLTFRRQDHEEKQQEICRLKMVIDRLHHAGVDELITVCPHSKLLPKYCSEFGVTLRPVDPAPIFASTIKTYLPDNPVIYSPDEGSIARAIDLAKLTHSQVVFTLKERGVNNEANIKPENTAEIKEIIAKYQKEKKFSEIYYADFQDAEKIAGQAIIMVEDEISTGGTANTTGQHLKALGARTIFLAAVHPVLTAGWRRRLFDNNPFAKIILGDTIPRGYEKMTGGRIHDISVADLVAQAVYNSLQ